MAQHVIVKSTKPTFLPTWIVNYHGNGYHGDCLLLYTTGKEMDATKKPLNIPADYSNYATEHNIFELFQVSISSEEQSLTT